MPLFVETPAASTGDAAAIAEPFAVASEKPSSAPRVGSTVNESPALGVADSDRFKPPIVIVGGLVAGVAVPTTLPVARSVSVYFEPSYDSA